MDVELNQSDCFKMMSFIKTSNQIALKVQRPLCLHKNLPLVTKLVSRGYKIFLADLDMFSYLLILFAWLECAKFQANINLPNFVGKLYFVESR